MEAPWLELRRETLDRESKPTARMVNKIIRESVTTRAKPRFFDFAEERALRLPLEETFAGVFIICGFQVVFLGWALEVDPHQK